MLAQCGCFAITVAVTLSFASATFQPARFLSGSAPQPPPQTIGWLEAVFHAQVTATGAVETLDRLHGSEPLAALLQNYLTRWRFAPARANDEAVDASVLVAAIYRPATLLDQTRPGGPPQTSFDRSSPAPTPALMPSPAYPPRGAGDGVVVVEILVTAEGKVAAASVIRSSNAAFNSSSLETARRWQFWPAPSAPRPAFAYLIFGFRQPVVTDRRR